MIRYFLIYQKIRIHSSAQEFSAVSLTLSALGVPKQGSPSSLSAILQGLQPMDDSWPRLLLPGHVLEKPAPLLASQDSLTTWLPFDLLCFQMRKTPTMMRTPRTGRTTARATAEEEILPGDGAKTETTNGHPQRDI